MFLLPFPTYSLAPPAPQGSSESDQINTIFKLVGTPSVLSWPGFPSLPAVASGLLGIVDVQASRRGGEDGCRNRHLGGEGRDGGLRNRREERAAERRMENRLSQDRR